MRRLGTTVRSGRPCGAHVQHRRHLRPAAQRCSSPAGGSQRSAVASAGLGFGVAAPKKDIPEYKRNKGACPCGSGLQHKDCCQPVIQSVRTAETAEELMRSRFSAYALKKPKWIRATTHADNPQREAVDEDGNSTFAMEVEATAKTTTFYRLEVLETKPGSSDDEALVKFQIWYKTFEQEEPEQKSRVEVSRFVREDGEWLYREAMKQETV